MKTIVEGGALKAAYNECVKDEVRDCKNCTLYSICKGSIDYRCEKLKKLDAEIQNRGLTIVDLEICRDKELECKQQLLTAQQELAQVKEELNNYTNSFHQRDEEYQLLKEEKNKMATQALEYFAPKMDKLEKDNKYLTQKLEKAKPFIENILYWETCPDNYKKELAKIFGLQQVIKELEG